jgi:hypothetical protein
MGNIRRVREGKPKRRNKRQKEKQKQRRNKPYKNWLENRRNGGRNIRKSKRILPIKNTRKNIPR